MEHRYAFILRIWQHKPAVSDNPTTNHDPELGELRGTLQAFDSAQVQHFSSLHDLHTLLHALLSSRHHGHDQSSASSGTADSAPGGAPAAG